MISDTSISRRNFVHGATGGALAMLAAAHTTFARELDRLPAVRKQYTLEDGLSYLNHGSIGTIPDIVQIAHNEYLRICERNPSLYLWGEQWEHEREAVRAKLATFLNCSANDLAITHNTTEGFNLLAQGLPLEKGDEVLFSSLNHAGASKCFEHMAAARGYQVRHFKIPMDRIASLTEAQVVQMHTNQIRSNTRLLVLPQIDNLVGLRHPASAIAKAARAKGAEFIAVDGAQAAGMIPVDLRAMDADFYCGSPHKWLQTPKGRGLFYIRSEMHDRLSPMWVTWGQSRWAGTARIFEDYGTRNLPELLAIGDALDFHRTTSWADRTAHLQRLRRLAKDHTHRIGADWLSPERWEMGASLYTIHLADVDCVALEKKLAARKIAVRFFPKPDGCDVRISPNLVNSEEDLDRLFTALA